MLLALRSLWESTGGAVIRKGAGLLLALQSLVLEPQSGSGDVTFTVTGVAANPQIGDVTQVAGTDESSGGVFQAYRLALQREAERQHRKRDAQFAIAGVAARPRIGKIERVDIASAPAVAGVAARARAGDFAVLHVDFPTDSALGDSAIGVVANIATNFQVAQGVAATPSVTTDSAVKTIFDLLEEEWIALLLAA